MSSKKSLPKSSPKSSKKSSKKSKSSPNSTMLRPFFPVNYSGCVSNCEPCFNWFLFGSRIFDQERGLFYLSIPQTTKLLNMGTFTSMNVKNMNPSKKMDIGSEPKLLIVSDPYNKKILNKKYRIGLCKSTDPRVTNECKLITDKKFLKGLVELSVELGYDGIAVHHEQCTSKQVSPKKFPLCMEALFFIKPELLEKTDETSCRLIRFSRMNNTQIRKKIDFPTNREINNFIKNKTLTRKELGKLLYKNLLKYAYAK